MTVLQRSEIKAGKTAVVVGLGVSGQSAIRLLVKQKVNVIVSESKSLHEIGESVIGELAAMGVELQAGGNEEHVLERADFVVTSPGVPMSAAIMHAAVKKNIPVIGEFGLAAMFLENPCIAITGTNGKTTVTALTGEMFKAAGRAAFVGGNIGIPLADYVVGSQKADAAVLEISSYQLDSGNGFRPDVAVLLNISPDHLDRYDSYNDYVLSKYSIFKYQTKADKAVLNRDDPKIIHELKEQGIAADCFFFGSEQDDAPGAFLKEDSVIVMGLGNTNVEQYDLSSTCLNGEPNRHNAMAAILAARLSGCAPAAVQQALKDFVALPHRLSFVAEVGGVSFIDDSKATNVGAVVSALESLERPIILLAGGRGKQGGYEQLSRLAGEKIKAAVLIGESKHDIARALEGKTRTYLADSMSAAVEKAAELACLGDAVLLSPACASFDMFQSYAHRGEEFVRAVRQLMRLEQKEKNRVI